MPISLEGLKTFLSLSVVVWNTCWVSVQTCSPMWTMALCSSIEGLALDRDRRQVAIIAVLASEKRLGIFYEKKKKIVISSHFYRHFVSPVCFVTSFVYVIHKAIRIFSLYYIAIKAQKKTLLQKNKNYISYFHATVCVTFLYNIDWRHYQKFHLLLSSYLLSFSLFLCSTKRKMNRANNLNEQDENLPTDLSSLQDIFSFRFFEGRPITNILLAILWSIGLPILLYELLKPRLGQVASMIIASCPPLIIVIS